MNVLWEREKPYPRRCKLPCKQNETFPNVIVFDFEAYQDPREKEMPTAESEHVPISVSLADAFDREPEHISAQDPNELLRKF